MTTEEMLQLHIVDASNTICKELDAIQEQLSTNDRVKSLEINLPKATSGDKASIEIVTKELKYISNQRSMHDIFQGEKD